MTDAERKLLLWCAVMLVRDTPPSAEEADEIDALIAAVRGRMDKLSNPMTNQFLTS